MSNRLIGLTWEKASLINQRLFFLALTKIDRNADQLGTVTIRASEYGELVDGSANSKSFYEKISKACFTIQKEFSIIEKDENKERFRSIIIFPTSSYTDGVIHLKFNEDAAPYLLNLVEKFTSAAIHEIMRIPSAYSCRLYLLVRQYRNLPNREFTVDAESLLKTLGCADKYPKASDFKRRVLEPAIKHLSEVGYDVKTNPVLKGRSVIAYHFKILSMPGEETAQVKAPELPEPATERPEKWHRLKARLLEIKVPGEIVDKVMSVEGVEEIGGEGSIWAIIKNHKASGKHKVIDSPEAYYSKVFSDYLR